MKIKTPCKPCEAEQEQAESSGSGLLQKCRQFLNLLTDPVNTGVRILLQLYITYLIKYDLIVILYPVQHQVGFCCFILVHKC